MGSWVESFIHVNVHIDSTLPVQKAEVLQMYAFICVPPLYQSYGPSSF